MKTKMSQKLFSISAKHAEMIEKLVDYGLFTSQSDVIRQAIVKLYTEHEEEINNKPNEKE